MKKILFLLLSNICFSQTEWKTTFEKGNGNQSVTYEDCIAYYQKLDAYFETIQMQEMGLTDSGKPLHLVIFSADKDFNFKSGKAKILINNGIHPGEPDGIDASMSLLRDLAMNKIKIPKNTQIIVIPVYNVGGMLNRSATSRTNQNGPEEYGFRGNARNFDLNRDFIKSDTKNSRSFQQIFHWVQPDVFLDNHVSNGADYQYTFTCIATQHERLGSILGNYFINEMYPTLVKDMQKKKIDVVPYVNIHGAKPDLGYEQFTDTPRYATGYTTLFHTLGFVPETHMLKPYKDRVKVTYEFMVSAINYVDSHSNLIQSKRKEAEKEFQAGMDYPLAWAIDSSKVSSLNFKGYEGKFKPSEVSGKDRLYYDRNQPFTKPIPFYANYKPTQFVKIPKAYIVPQAQWPIVELLKLNNLQFYQLEKDTIIEVESYKILEYQTAKTPYEGHYGHYNTKISKTSHKLKFLKGDYVFPTDQFGVKYLLETLEPEAVDSFFNWNYFDAILQQKEYFSAYVFEDMAKEILNQNPELKAEFERKKNQDKSFSDNGAAQLDWIYKHSVYFEKAHMHYPVYRILN